MFTKRLPYLLLGLLLLAGCRGGSKVVSQAEGFDFEEMMQHPWAVGGVVINSTMVPDGAAEKELQPLQKQWSGFSETCAPMLYGGLLRVAPEMELWTFDTVMSRVPEADLKALLKDLERSRQAAPGSIRNLSEYLPKVSYVAFGRLDNTELVTNQDMASTVVDQMNRDGRQPHANTLSRTVSLRRGIYMSMEVYKISTGTMVWSGEADYWNAEFLDGDANEQSNDVQVLKNDDESEVTQILMDGTMRNGPGLIDGIRSTCVKLTMAMKQGTIEEEASEDSAPF